MSRIQEWLVNPTYTVRVHAIFGAVWLIIGTPVTIFWLSSSVSFIAWMSLYAIVVAHWSGFQGAHAEKRVKDDESKQK